MSRYPIVVNVEDDHTIYFYDPRGNNTSEVDYRIAALRVDTNKNKYVVWSPRIVNKRYRQWGEAYNTILSSSVKKITDKLSEVLTSFTEIELATRSYSYADSKFDEWLRESRNAYVEAQPNGYHSRAHIMQLLIEDFVAASNGAAPYTTGKLTEYLTPELIAAYEENKARINTKRPNINVFINPDGLVHMVRNKKEESTDAENYEVIGKFNSFDELPQGMREACSMLKLTEGGTYVQNVGYKHPTHNAFWIYE